ncbi:hypothetical protein PISMIDRAFT_203458 [Pisolithus microcarpus 441]|uniref:Uncharacterized protein n=1 Tax=Pisolithus microcarpus 441 TaxID=765257 RepID=A0A0D0A5A6_9AGAM|nr:hypothetical protein PISMIDRAFT_203458 [Pisolithus microcarpus 441]
MRTYALQQRYGNDFAFSSRRSEGMHYVCSRLSERSTEDSRTDADDSACRCGSMLVVSLYRGCVSSGGGNFLMEGVLTGGTDRRATAARVWS